MPYIPILQWTGSHGGSPGPPQIYTTGAVEMHPTPEGADGQGAAVFSFGGALYQVLETYVSVTTAPFLQPIQVFKSIDAGATWAILDLANSPMRKFQSIGVGVGEYSGGVWYNGGSTLTVVYLPLSSVITLRDFDLLTGTWGADYGIGPVVPAINQLFKRSTGDWVVIGPTTWPLLVNPTGLSAYVLSAGVWNTFALDSNVSVGYQSTSGNAAVIDSVDTIHVFARTANVPVYTQAQVLYQQFKADNTLGAYHNFGPTDFYISQGGAFGQTANPIIVAGQILWGVADTLHLHPTILIGSSLTIPVWTVLGGDGIDPGFTPADQGNGTVSPTLTTDGTTIWGVYVFDDYITNIATTLRLCQTCNVADPTLGWSGAEIYVDTPNNWNEWGQSPTISGINQFPMITIQAPVNSSSSNAFTNWFFIPPADSQSICGGAPCPTIVLGVVAGCIQASGGTAPYSYAVTAGALPGGLVLDAVTGCISGIPVVTGSFGFVVTATDVTPCTGSQAFDIAVSAAGAGAVAFSVCQSLCCTQLLGLGTTGGVSYSFPGSM